MRTLVFAYARMNPPTIGHDRLVKKVMSIAEDTGGTPYLVLSHSRDCRDNPLLVADKLIYAKKFWRDIHISAATPDSPSFLTFLRDVQFNYDRAIMVAGSDRVDEMGKKLVRYNHVLYDFDIVDIFSCGDRDPDSYGIEGVSATKMRQYALDNDLESFLTGVPGHLSKLDAIHLMNLVQRGLDPRR